MNQPKLHTQKEFARLMGVIPQAVSKVRHRLRFEEVSGVKFVVDCEENKAIFSNPAHNRKKIEK
jgi:hypothetical protein